MNVSFFQRTLMYIRSRRLPSRLGSLVLVIQRSPLVKLLPEARVISTSGFSDVFTWTVTAIAGLGAYDSVSGATAVVQTAPVPNSSTVPSTGGASLAFLFQVTGAGGHTPATFQITSGTLPTGLKLTGKKNSTTDSITGVPTQTGNFPITIKAWENSDNTGRSASGNFTIAVTAPPAPTITAHPTGGSFLTGQMAKLSVTANSAFTYTWKKGGTALPTGESILFTKTSPRKYLVPTADIGTTWRTDPAFDDTAWSSTSGGIGYDTNTSVNFNPAIAAGGTTGTTTGSVYIRMPFTLNDPLALSFLSLKVQCDDGFIAYLNGTEIASQNKPATPAWNSLASASAVDADALIFQPIAINQHLHLLSPGINLLAVQALNQSKSSSDLLFNCELSGGINAANSSKLVLAGLSSQDAGAYTVTATNTTSSVTSNPATVSVAGGIPVIDTQPASVSISSGATAQLSVAASGPDPLSYQWYTGASGDTSLPVSGAILAGFTTPALTTTTSYWVRVTNGSGSLDSSAATVTVLATPPAITTQPASVSINAGSTAQLHVAASGTAPFTYAWFTGPSGDTSQPVANAITDTLTTQVLTATTSYWVRVTNAASSVNSATATVTVLDAFTSWKNAQFTASELGNPSISGPAADPDGDGLSNENEYVFGTLPKSPSPSASPAITKSGVGVVTVSFTAVAAAGQGYEGRARHYAVETFDNASSGGSWSALAGYNDITAAGQTVQAVLPGSASRALCRLKVWLTP